MTTNHHFSRSPSAAFTAGVTSVTATFEAGGMRRCAEAVACSKHPRQTSSARVRRLFLTSMKSNPGFWKLVLGHASTVVVELLRFRGFLHTRLGVYAPEILGVLGKRSDDGTATV